MTDVLLGLASNAYHTCAYVSNQPKQRFKIRLHDGDRHDNLVCTYTPFQRTLMALHAPCRGGSTAWLQLIKLQRRQHPKVFAARTVGGANECHI